MDMQLLRSIALASAAAAVTAISLFTAPAYAQTKIAIGKVVGGNGLHIPSYVADAAGIFK
jgi:ABC-type nitrate/sulfonate/bicarbonate transport system substrate-binding protein